VSRSTVERRSHARFPHSFEIEGPTEADGSVARMTASDLSLGGLYCSSSRDYPEMTRLAVRLRLPAEIESAPVDVEAVVVRRERRESASGNGRFELALFFTRMGDDAREALARFLARGPTTR
jgi:hypothetical protein